MTNRYKKTKKLEVYISVEEYKTYSLNCQRFGQDEQIAGGKIIEQYMNVYFKKYQDISDKLNFHKAATQLEADTEEDAEHD